MTEGAIWLLSSGDRAVRTVFSGWKSLSQVAFRAGPCPSAPHPPVTLSRAAGGSLSPHRRLETLQKQPPREGVSHTRAGQARPSAWVPTGPRLQLEPVRPTRGGCRTCPRTSRPARPEATAGFSPWAPAEAAEWAPLPPRPAHFASGKRKETRSWGGCGLEVQGRGTGSQSACFESESQFF